MCSVSMDNQFWRALEFHAPLGGRFRLGYMSTQWRIRNERGSRSLVLRPTTIHEELIKIAFAQEGIEQSVDCLPYQTRNLIQ